ncbi:MAG: PEP-CTERM sorting domain-containing protein [Cyanobacteria bacterium J06627_28]
MNPIVTFIKKRGTTIALPLLLLTTACGEGGGIPDSFTGSDAVDALSEYQLTKVDDGSYTIDKVGAANKAVKAASVPEPFTIAGIAVTALGLGALKRRA